MSEDEDCDELPMITVNSSANDSTIFAMPSADVLASQRARELAGEEELLRLREKADADERQAASEGVAMLFAHSDSSGSEGEAALAAAVTAMQMTHRAARSSLRAAQLWNALAQHLPPLAQELQKHLQGASETTVAAYLEDVVASVASTLVSDTGPWADEELMNAGSLLCMAVLAHEVRSRRPATRALHALLDEHASTAQVSKLARLLVSSFPAAQIRLELSDAVRSGGDGEADRLATILSSVAMLDLLDPSAKELEEASVSSVADAAPAWRRLSVDSRYSCVQLAGRVLAGTCGEHEARARLLAAMAPPAAGSDAQRPDRLKVLVGASRLRLLFHSEN